MFHILYITQNIKTQKPNSIVIAEKKNIFHINMAFCLAHLHVAYGVAKDYLAGSNFNSSFSSLYFVLAE